MEHRSPAPRSIVVGILPDQPLWVVQVAADFARAFDAELVCVAADPARYAYQELPDGSVLTAPIDPDLLETEPLLSEDRLAALREVLAESGVRWTTRELVGAAADALIAVADEVGALMIVVGARPGGFLAAVRSALTGSVALRLAHRQHRPVVVVPTTPDGSDVVAPPAG